MLQSAVGRQNAFPCDSRTAKHPNVVGERVPFSNANIKQAKRLRKRGGTTFVYPPQKKSGLEKDGNRWIGLVPTLIRSYGQTCTCSSKPGESSMTVTGMYANNVQLPSCADVVSVP